MTDRRDDIREEREEECSLLRPRQTREEIEAEKRRLKQQKREAARQKRRQARTAGGLRNPLIWLAIAGGVLLVAGIVGFLVVGTNVFGNGKEKAADSGYFVRPNDEPEMSEEGIKGVVREAYFTRDGHMAVLMRLSNGLPTRHYLTALQIKIYNEDGETVASGYTETIPEDFVLEPNGVADFLLYISPEYVFLPEDDLNSLTYEIKTQGRVEDESVLATRTTAAS